MTVIGRWGAIGYMIRIRIDRLNQSRSFVYQEIPLEFPGKQKTLRVN